MRSFGSTLSVLAMIWAAAVVCKVVVVVSRGEPYRFTQWDGGLLLRGKAIGRRGTIAFGLLVVGLGAIAAYQCIRWSRL